MSGPKMLGIVGKRVRFESGWAKVREEYEYDVLVEYEEGGRVRQVRKGAILETA